MTLLDIAGLGFAYPDGTVALREVSLKVDEGQKVAVVGPNGAGKSTLLQLIAGFRMPFTGRVTVAGRALDEPNSDEIRRDLGLLFQDPDDQIFMPTVEEDVAFGPRNLGMNDIEGRVLRGLRDAGIERLAKRQPHKLSYGMKKRVAIAGVLAMDPKILLLDEPTSGLDPRSRVDLIKFLKRMDRTMLIATHDLEAAAEVVDRAIVLNEEIVMEGTLRELIVQKDLLERYGLELPPVSKLFEVLGAMGYPIGNLPVSMDQAVVELTKVIGRDGKHLHAHIHKCGHSEQDDRTSHEHGNKTNSSERDAGRARNAPNR